MPKAVDGWKVCSLCRKKKPVSEFHRNKRQPDGYQYPCKACTQAHYEANRGEILVRCAKYRATEAGKAAQKRGNASGAYKRGNQRYRQSEKGQAACKRGNASEAKRQGDKRRRALEAGALSDMAPESWKILSTRHPECNYCGHGFSANGGPFKRTLDHIVPLSRGGQHALSNLVYACSRCNSSKGTKLPEEWVDRWYERTQGGQRSD